MEEIKNPDPIHEHLGDGAYVTFEGDGLILKANHHLHPTDKVYLDTYAVEALIRFAKRVGVIKE